MSVTDKWVIIGQSGEYFDRTERVIGYCDSEADAQQAVDKAESEKSLPDPVPYPAHVDTHAWFLGGNEVDHRLDKNRVPGLSYLEKPDAAGIRRIKEAGVDAWRKGLINAGRIDIDGQCEMYYYQRARTITIGQ